MDSSLDSSLDTKFSEESTNARIWAKALAPYREPNYARSIVEIVITLGPLVILWVLAWAAYHLATGGCRC
jgi:hypothetical protein